MDDFPQGGTDSSSCSGEPSPVLGSIMIALVVIGLIGNSLVFFTILVLHEYKKSVTNWYILQLTLADTLFLLMLPFTAHSEVVGAWEFSLSLCKFKEAVIFINYYASIYFLVIMSFDRYLAVTKAFDSRKWLTSLRSPTASYVISISGWVLSALLCVQLYRYSQISNCQCEYSFPLDPLLDPDTIVVNENDELHELGISETDSQLTRLFKDYFDRLSPSFSDNLLFNNSESILTNSSSPAPLTRNESQTTVCILQKSQEFNVWIYGNFLGAFILPFVLICYFYGMIMKTVRSASLVESNLKQKSYRRRVTMIVFALVSLFAVTWLPWYVEKIVRINVQLPFGNKCRELANIVRVIAYMNSALNPYFYSFLGFHFRDRLRRAGNRVFLVMTMKSYRPSTKRKRQHGNSSSISAGYRNNQNALPTGKTSSQDKGLQSGRARTSQKTEKTYA